MNTIAGLGPWELTACLAIIGLAGVVRGYSGFGFSALVVMSLVLILPPAEVVPIAFILEVVASVAMLPPVWRQVRWDIAGWLLVGAAIGNPLGIQLLAKMPPHIMKFTISALVLAASLLLVWGYKLSRPAGPAGVVSTGFLSGFVNGIGAIGGLPVVLILFASATGMATLRATVVGYLFLSDIYAIALSGLESLLTPTLLQRTAIFIVPLALGIFLGSRLFRVTTPENFRRFTLVLLISLSLAGIVQSIGIF